MNLRPDLGPDGIISVDHDGTGAEWCEACEFRGMTAHVGGLHLAQLRIVERMAERVGDDVFAQQCREWIEQGSESIESKLWTGKYYLNYYDPKTEEKSDIIFALMKMLILPPLCIRLMSLKRIKRRH